MIRIRRIYDAPGKEDGARVLVDRLWPRGLSKSGAAVRLWMKEIAPSGALRQWFAHDPAKWKEFRRRYARELGSHADLLRDLRRMEREAGTLTLLYSAKNERKNNAAVLAEFLRQ